MNCLIVDDEPLAIQLIEDYVKNVPFLSLKGSFLSALEAIQVIREREVDLIFLDINMPNLSGVDMIRSIENPPMVIFTTAHTKYAIDGFDLSAVDYLLKPIAFPRFLKAVNKAWKLYSLSRTKADTHSAETGNSIDDFLMVRSEYKTLRIDLRNISYIEGLKDYVKIYCGKTRPVLTKTTMIKLEEKLGAENFLRVHKSFIVSLSKIESIENNRILIDEKRIPIGNSYRQNFLSRLNDLQL